MKCKRAGNIVDIIFETCKSNYEFMVDLKSNMSRHQSSFYWPQVVALYPVQKTPWNAGKKVQIIDRLL